MALPSPRRAARTDEVLKLQSVSDMANEKELWMRGGAS